MTTRIVMILVFLAICSQSGFGNMIDDPADLSAIKAESLKQFLTPDGRFDLEAARRSGYEGTLDFSGFGMSFDPRTGEPLFSRVDQEGTLEGDQSGGQRTSRPCQQGKDMDDVVRALTVYPTDLIVGGTFVSAGCIRVGQVASWDGSSWDYLGCGVQSLPFGVYSLTVYAGDLIVGGYFFGAGCWPGIPANHIARWNGSSWSALGTGMSGGGPYTAVYALTVYAGKLIAGGNFIQASGTSAKYIAQWNGSSWSSLGSGMSHAPPTMYPTVYALTVYGTDLIAGGEFDSAGGTPASDIARWNGSSWSALGSGIQGQVYALTVYGTDLIAGGLFTQAGGTSANYIAGWNGSSWSALGTGMSGGWFTHVAALTVYGGELIAGGVFTHAGPVSVNHIARWNGGSWNALGAGMFGTTYPGVYALTVYNTDLIAGGNFTYAGMNQANYIARWNGSSWSRLGYTCGDTNGDGVVDLGDVVYLISYLYKGGPAPNPLEVGDATCDGVIDIGDVVYLIEYLYRNGPPPPGC